MMLLGNVIPVTEDILFFSRFSCLQTERDVDESKVHFTIMQGLH